MSEATKRFRAFLACHACEWNLIKSRAQRKVIHSAKLGQNGLSEDPTAIIWLILVFFLFSSRFRDNTASGAAKTAFQDVSRKNVLLLSFQTRMQSLSHGNATISKVFRDMVQQEGITRYDEYEWVNFTPGQLIQTVSFAFLMSLSSRPMRGIGAVVLGAGPAHAFYFSTYEFTKEKLTELKFNDNLNYSKIAIRICVMTERPLQWAVRNKTN